MRPIQRCEKLPGVLIPWYQENKRDLPWRKDREPYHVWLSEIMLQQTRVEAVKGYYTRFLQALPTVEDLANCDDDSLHKLWEGLGYYSRVRNLKKAAQRICSQYGGEFPEDYEVVRALPGIGDYTAGAVCSICFDMPTPAVDGNVLRLLSRLLGDDTPIDLLQQKKKLHDLLSAVYPPSAGEFTQALMELGATVCGPNRAPDCEHCPCKGLCTAYAQGTQGSLPVKLPKKEKRLESYTLFIIGCNDRYALQKRGDSGLLAGLWQFPNVPGTLELPQALEKLEELGFVPAEVLRQREMTHIFTHIRWQMRGFYLTVREEAPGYIWMTKEEIESAAALPTAFRQFWEGM